MEDYERLFKIGDGAQGKVFRVRHRKTMKEYALKVIKCRDQAQVNFALKEIKVLMELRNPHIVSYIDFFLDFGSTSDIAVCLVLSLCDRGDLQQRISDAKQKFISTGEHSCKEELVVKWVRQCAEALDYLHSKGFIHRDVKPTNVFFCSKEDVVLGDFGLAASVGAVGRRSAVGTPYYFAPELMLRQAYDGKADIWGLGVVLYELLTLRERPLNSEALANPSSLDSVVHQIQEMGFSAKLAHLVRQMLHRESASRPSAATILGQLTTDSPQRALSTGSVRSSGNDRTPKRTSGLKQSHVDVTPGRPMCDLCEDSFAEVRCAECDEALCRLCDAQQHRGKRYNHRRVPASVHGQHHLQERGSMKCTMCDVFAAAVSCDECKEALCEHCDTVTHKHNRRSTHVRCPITPAPRLQVPKPQPPMANGSGERGSGTHHVRPVHQVQLVIPKLLPTDGEPGTAPLKNNIPQEERILTPRTTNALGGAKPTGTQPPSGRQTAQTKQPAAEDPPAKRKSPVKNQLEDRRRSTSTVLRVPGEYPTISAALAAATRGCTVLIEEGTYEESFVIREEIELVGVKGGARPKIVSCAKSVVTLDCEKGKISHVSITQSKATSSGSAAGGTSPLRTQQHEAGNSTSRPLALDIRGGSWEVADCTVSSATGSCIGVSGKGTSPTVTSCVASQGRQAGFFIFDSAGGTYERNTVSHCDHTGVLVKRHATPIFTGNIIERCRETGVFCHDSAGSFQGNTIRLHKGCGVVIKGGANPTFHKNTIESCGQAGIFCCDRSTGTLSENTVLGNQKAGLLIKTEAHPAVRRNVFTQGKETGIYVFDGGLGFLEQNRIERNSNAGILVTSGGNPHVVGNFIQGNTYEGVWVCKGGKGRFEENDLRGNTKGPKDIDAGCTGAVVWAGSNHAH